MIGFIPIIFLITLLGVQFVYVGDTRPYVPLFFATALTFCIGLCRGKKWKDLSAQAFATVAQTLNAMAVYLLIGPMIASWIASGTLPFFIIGGAKLVTSRTLLPVAFALTALAGIPMGSGISVVGTVGVAMAGLAEVLGVSLPEIAGAVAAGAFWGNAVSPASSSTNVAVPLVGSTVGDHTALSLKKLWIPFVLSLLFYALWGVHYESQVSATPELLLELEEFFHPSWISVLPLLLLLGMMLLGKPTLVSFFCSITAALLLALFSGRLELASVPSLLVDGYRYGGSNAKMALMLNRGGFNSMMSLVLLLLTAMTFGGSFKASGLLDDTMKLLTRMVRGAWSLRLIGITAVTLTGAFTGSIVLSIVLVGGLLAPLCSRYGLSNAEFGVVLAGAAVTSAPLFPWSSCGTCIITVMHLPAGTSGLMYVPFSSACLITVLWLIFSPLSRKDEGKSL